MNNIFTKQKMQEFVPRAHEFCLYVLLLGLMFSKAIAEIALIAAVVLWIVRKTYLGEKWFEKTGYNIILLAFLVVSSLSLVESEFIFVSLRGLLKLVRQLLIFFMVVDVFRGEKQFGRLLKVVSAGWLIILLDGIWQYSFGWDFLRHIEIDYTSSHVRVSASMTNFGIFATFIIVYIPLFMCIAMNRGMKKSERLLAFFLLLLSLLSLYRTHSRGAWVACLIALLFFGIVSGRKLIIPLIIVACVVGVLVLPRSALIHLDAYSKEQSIVERFVLWQRAIDVIAARPILGTGINTYDLSHAKYDKHKSWRVKEYYAHNGYLQMAAETGLVSLGLFLAFIAILFILALKSLSHSINNIDRMLILWLVTALVGYLAFAMVDTIMHNKATIYLFWFMCGLLVAVIKLAKSTAKITSV